MGSVESKLNKKKGANTAEVMIEEKFWLTDCIFLA